MNNTQSDIKNIPSEMNNTQSNDEIKIEIQSLGLMYNERDMGYSDIYLHKIVIDKLTKVYKNKKFYIIIYLMRNVYTRHFMKGLIYHAHVYHKYKLAKFMWNEFKNANIMQAMHDMYELCISSCQNRNLKFIKFIFSRISPEDIIDKDHYLHAACIENNSDLIELLLDYGAKGRSEYPHSRGYYILNDVIDMRRAKRVVSINLLNEHLYKDVTNLILSHLPQ